MGTGVDEGADTAIALANNKDRLAAHKGGVIVAMGFDLTFVTQIDPTPFEYLLQFPLKNIRVRVDPPINAEQGRVRALHNQLSCRHCYTLTRLYGN